MMDMMPKSRRSIKIAGNDISPNAKPRKMPIIYEQKPYVVVQMAGESSALQIYEDRGKGDYKLIPHKYFFNLDAAKVWLGEQR